MWLIKTVTLFFETGMKCEFNQKSSCLVSTDWIGPPPRHIKVTYKYKFIPHLPLAALWYFTEFSQNTKRSFFFFNSWCYFKFFNSHDRRWIGLNFKKNPMNGWGLKLKWSLFPACVKVPYSPAIYYSHIHRWWHPHWATGADWTLAIVYRCQEPVFSQMHSLNMCLCGLFFQYWNCVSDALLITVPL